jgi:hypothetical protein
MCDQCGYPDHFRERLVVNHPVETELAKKLHAVYRKWAGNMGAGDHLPETWNAVAAAAEIAAHERTTRPNLPPQPEFNDSEGS